MAEQQRGHEEDTARSRMEALIAAMRRPKAERASEGERPREREGASADDDRLAEIARRAVQWPVGDASDGGRPGEGVEEARHLERGAVVGRYMVLRELGAGGMGVVYAAYDPELDRKVALKVVAPGMMGDEGRTRLLREAQALAKLSHRNVVAIHDMGTMGEQVWLAMELLRGQTLREWLREPRDWREVLAVMRKAGRGLAAAHAAGLLHRDFKPENVMVGHKGGVKVMDFGLARAHGQEGDALTVGEPEESVRTAVPVVNTLAMGVTQAGVMVGTPHYMAPEQLVGAEVTAAADQFALCVTLWEGLYGERPFAGGVLEEVAGEMLAGRVREPARGRAVPGWLRKVCERGLRLRAEERFASMEALLEALTKGRTRARVRKGLVAVGVVSVIGLGVEGYRRLDEARRIAACEASGDEIEKAWNEERRQALHDGIVATGVSYAETTAEKVMPWLDRQADAWRGARVDACLDAEVRGRWAAETYERSLLCLDERMIELESMVEVLTSADADVLPRAVGIASGPKSVSPCRDETTLRLMVPPPREHREALRGLQAAVTRTGNLMRAGRYQEGLELARDTVDDATRLGWRPLLAAAKLRHGGLLQRMGAYADAEIVLEDAYFEGAQGVAPEVAVAAATDLAFVVGARLKRHADGERWGRHAKVALIDVRDEQRLDEARLLTILADVHGVAGDREKAIALDEEALSIFEEVVGPEDLRVAGCLTGLAWNHQVGGAYDEARALLERAIPINEGVLGPEHPDVVAGLSTLAAVHKAKGNYDEAKEYFEKALLIDERTLGTVHPEVAMGLMNLATVYAETGDRDEARRLLERALVIHEKTLAPDHPNVALNLMNLANIHAETGDHVEAKTSYERALSIFEKALGAGHLNVAYCLDNLANVYSATGDYDASMMYHERALAIFEAALGPAHPSVAASIASMGSIHLARGEHEEANARFERALAIQEQSLGHRHPDVAKTLVNVAIAHVSLGQLEAARTSYERALAIQEEALGPAHSVTANTLTGLASIALAQHRPTDALGLVQRALAVQEKSGAAADDTARVQFVLAQALWDVPLKDGRDRSRSLRLARHARGAFRDAGERRIEELAEVEQWLRRVDSVEEGNEKR